MAANTWRNLIKPTGFDHGCLLSDDALILSMCEKYSHLFKWMRFKVRCFLNDEQIALTKKRGKATMKKRFATISGTFALLLSGLMIAGCSNTQISTELQLNHPANEEAEESVFVRPPNPFIVDVSDIEPELSPDIPGEQEKYREGSMHHGDMQTMKNESGSHDRHAGENKKHQH
jgi:hypothetical protein